MLVPGNTPTSTTRDAVMPSSHRLRRNGVTKNARHCLRCCCVLVVVARPHHMHGVQIYGPVVTDVAWSLCVCVSFGRNQKAVLNG